MGEAKRRKEYLKTHKLSIEQARNVRSEIEGELKDGTFKKNIAVQINEEAQITTAPYADRVAYLMNGLKAFETVSPVTEKCFLRITGAIASSFTRREICLFLKKIMLARVEGYTYKFIGEQVHMAELLIHQLDELAKIAIHEEISNRGFKDPVMAS